MDDEEALMEAIRCMSQYDENAKTILADKDILANILVYTVDEFLGMNPKDVKGLIEEEPSVGNTPVAPGLTNKKEENGDIIISGMETGQEKDEYQGAAAVDGEAWNSLIVGINTESNVRNEGVTYFDILFYVRTKDGLSKVIINLEAQKGEPYRYDVEMRGIYYASREISSQLHREFANQRYNEIKKVYSIWIVMDAKEETMSKIHLHKEDIMGTSRWKSMYDILNVMIIRIRNTLPEDSTQKLHRLLGALFAENVPFEKRCNVLEEFGIGLVEDQKGMVNRMCNLGEGIWERGIERGMEQGKIDVAMRMIEDGDVPFEKIALYCGLSLEQVLELKKELQPV